MDDPFFVEEKLRKTYLSYVRSPFRLRDARLAKERDELIGRPGYLYQPMLLEPVPAYQLSEHDAVTACSELGIDAEVGGFLQQGLFPSGRRLYNHQLDAWRQCRQGRPVVVTSGTGSGKTEAFMIPVLAAICEEMLKVGKGPGRRPNTDCFWRTSNNATHLQRQPDGHRRRPALRALLLYPLNALVEDQLGRLRVACDRERPHNWLDNNVEGDRIWFGRYTSMTPVSGEPNSANKRRQLRKDLRQMDEDWRAAAASTNNDAGQFFQNPEGSEMWGRWDMQAAPPDIMITNYSMLNIMLMRRVEESIWERTSEWLKENPSNIFHVVIDELHSYRGTQGTEIAFLLRSLLARIGLTPGHAQLRIIATSASLERGDPRSLDFLSGFFGVERSLFAVLPGERVRYHTSRDFEYLAAEFAACAEADQETICRTIASGADGRQGALAQKLDEIGVFNAILSGAESTDSFDHSRPFTTPELGARLWPDIHEAQQIASAKGLVRATAAARLPDGRAPLQIRAHLFFHALGRVWACTSPNCSEVIQDGIERPVGVLHAFANPVCKCGSRVLELLVA